MNSGISVIIPAFNEETYIAATIKSAKSIHGVSEVIVIDDGSTDRTAEVAELSGASKVIRQRNLGKGAALNAGYRASKENIILMLDADLGETAEKASALLPPVTSKQADMAIASFPYLGKGGGMGFAVRLSRNTILRLTGQEMHSPLSGQRALRREVLDKIGGFAPRFAAETALTIDALRAGFKIIEIPLDMKHRRTGKTFAGFLHRGRQFYDILKVSLNRSLLRQNFKGNYVPIRGYLPSIALAIIWLAAGPIFGLANSFTLALSILGLSIVGLLDDIWGNRNVGGFRGHLGKLIKERIITTGFIKLFAGGAIALIAAYAINISGKLTIYFVAFDALLIALFTNAVNLLDLRPGRAVFFSMSILVLLSLLDGRTALIALPAIAIFAFFDSKGKMMLGDSGSNALGVMLGILVATGLGLLYKAAVLILLIGLHIYSEKWSISDTIEKSRVLRWMDRRLGVR